jgi:hypothetical protein
MDFKLATPFLEAFEELDKLNESPLKTWRISYYEDEVKKSFTVQAASKEEAEQIGWSRVDADSLYVSEVVNEDAKFDASKKFWAAAKINKIDEESFHTAYDDELRDLGLMDVFTAEGAFVDRGVYGKIKAAKEANPNSWAVIALNRLWVLRYKENVKFASEIAANKAAEDEAQRRAEQRRQEEEAAKAAKEEKFKEHQETLKTYISKVDSEIVSAYEQAAGVPATEGVSLTNEGEVPGRTWRDKPTTKFGIHFKGWNRYCPITEAEFINEAAMIKLLTGIFNQAVEYINLKAATEEFKKIDIFANNRHAEAVLLGESGTLYDVGTNGFGNLMISVNREKAVPAYIITEPYEVIYASTDWNDGNSSTRRDSHSATYYSWNSKYTDELGKLGKRIPTKYGREEGYIGSYTETKKVENPSSKNYSHADGIDSWVERYSVAGATD